MRFPNLGPSIRPTPPQQCACGRSYSRYWVHRETKHHKDAVKRWRKEDREAKAA